MLVRPTHCDTLAYGLRLGNGSSAAAAPVAVSERMRAQSRYGLGLDIALLPRTSILDAGARMRRSRSDCVSAPARADGARVPVERAALSRAVAHALFRRSPSRTRLSAVATIASSLERGAQPSVRLAFSPVAFLIL